MLSQFFIVISTLTSVTYVASQHGLLGVRRGVEFFSFQRSTDIAELEHYLTLNEHVGLCHNQAPLLAAIPIAACRRITCLKSPKTGQNIDFTVLPLAVLSRDVLQEACSEPRGGQLEMSLGTRPTVSFIISFKNGIKLTMQCVLELFRTSDEADSVEFVLVNDGSTEDVRPLKWVMERLRSLFGVKYVMLHNPTAVRYLSSGCYLKSAKSVL